MGPLICFVVVALPQYGARADTRNQSFFAMLFHYMQHANLGDFS